MALSAAEVRDAIIYAITHGGDGADPVVSSGSPGNVAGVELIQPILRTAPGDPEYLGVRHILLITE